MGLTFADMIRRAMDKGYDIKDTKYKTSVGEGESKQDHEMVFNLKRPQQ
jgi:hypothetical protein